MLEQLCFQMRLVTANHAGPEDRWKFSPGHSEEATGRITTAT